MHRVGAKGLFWPMKDDVILCTHENVVGLVPEPQPGHKTHEAYRLSLEGTLISF